MLQIYYTAAGFFAGVFGTGLGGIFALFLDRRGRRFLSAVLEFTAGLMLAVSLLDLLPAAFENASLIVVLLSVSAGVALVFCVDGMSRHCAKSETSGMYMTGVSMAISIALHNFPEGLAIGSAFGSSTRLGLTLFVAIMLHDIPEGVALAVPLKYGGVSAGKLFLSPLCPVSRWASALISARLPEKFLLYLSRSACLSPQGQCFML